MHIIQKILFYTWMIIWTTIIGVGLFPISMLSHSLASRVGQLWCKGVIWSLKIIFNIRYEFQGLENLPENEGIIACKHQSMFDTIVFLSLTYKTCYILKKELIYIPVYGQYSPAMGMIPIRREGGAKSLKEMLKITKDRLSRGRKIVIFPEGTRTKVGEFKGYQSGISAIYKYNNYPVTPVALNSGLYWPKGGAPKGPGKIIIRILPPIEAGLQKQEFLSQLENAIEPNVKELEQRHD